MQVLWPAFCAAALLRCSDPGEGAGVLTAEPPSVELGRVVFGGAARREITLANRGDRAVFLRDLKISPGLEGELRVDGLPAQLLIDRTHVIDVVLEPSAPGPREGTITLELEQASAPSLVIPVRAVAEAASLGLRPSTIEFGRVRLGQSATATITLTNNSDLERRIRAAAFEPGSSTAFRVGLGAARVLEPGSSLEVPLFFRPEEPGQHRARIVFDDGSLAATASLIASGEGVPAVLGFRPMVLDFFEAPLGTIRERSFDLLNLTPIAQTVRAWRIEGSSAFQVELPDPPFAIEGAGSLRFAGRFSPLEERPHDARLILEIQDEPEAAEAPLAATGIARGAPAIEATPRALWFGPIEAGEEARLPLWIENAGLAPLAITSLRADDPAFRVETPEPLPELLRSGEKHRVDVVAIGRAAGREAQANLQIFAAQIQGSYDVALAVEGSNAPLPRLYAPDSIDLGLAVVGLRHGRVLPIKNIGTATLAISDLRLTDDVERRFDLALPSSWTFPLLVAPGELLRVPITFGESGDLVSRIGVLAIHSDDPIAPLKEARFVMRAVQPDAIDQLRVCLIWGDRGRNIDLHVVPQGSAILDSPRALSWCNPSPDLGVAGDRSDDPILRIDAVDRATEECAELSSAPSGRYTVAADFVRQNEPPGTTSTVWLELRSAGRVVASQNRTIAAGQRWVIGAVEWDRAQVGIALDARLDPVFEPSTRECY